MYMYRYIYIYIYFYIYIYAQVAQVIYIIAFVGHIRTILGIGASLLKLCARARSEQKVGSASVFGLWQAVGLEGENRGFQ